MKSNPMSVGKIFLTFWLLAFLVACASKIRSTQPPMQGTVSLAEDRKEIEELRKNIPEEIRMRNDSLKEILSMMGEVKHHPQRVRQRFDRLHRKRRDKFRKTQRRRRRDFSKEERRKREDFLEKLREERESSKAKDLSREERKDFYDDQDQRRKEFFADLRDKRKEFETEMRQQNKDFYAELRAQRKEFNEEWRIYNRRWRDWQKSKKEGHNRQPVNPTLQEFERMNQMPGQSLGTEDGP